MNRQTIARTLAATTIATSMLFAPMAFAEGDIVKCTGADGRVTLTDSACEAGESSVTVVTGAAPVLASVEAPAAEPTAAPSVARTVRMARERMPSGDVARKALARLDPPSRSLGRDVATLKAARQAMQLMDSAASAMKARRIAGLQ